MRINKVIMTLTMAAALVLTPANPSYAADETVDYGISFEFQSPVHIETPEGMDLVIKLVDDNNEKIFYMGMCANYIYINEEVDVYAEPNTNTKSYGKLLEGARVFRAAYNIYGWNIVQLDGVNYFLYIEDNESLKPIDGVVYEEMDEPYVAPVQSYSGGGNYANYGGYAPEGLSAKEWIAMKESGGNYNAVSASGTYIGRYQLSADKLNGDYSVENQERVADAYVYSTYGSWEAAQQFWLSHGWY